MVIEVFGFSPRAGLPDTHIHTFASTLHNRDKQEGYVDREAYDSYLANNPHNESRFVYPVSEGSWQDGESVAEDATEIMVRGQVQSLPGCDEYERQGIGLEESNCVRVFELCRWLAEVAREQVLAMSQERRISVLPEMAQILQLEEWHHPNLVEGEVASDSETFQQLAQVLATGDVGLYRPPLPANTHWRNWPDGGTL
jgi:hypothetical protein